MGDDVVQLARDPRSFAAGGVLEQVAGGGLPRGVVAERLAARALRDSGERRGRREASEQHGEHAGFGVRWAPGCASASTRNTNGRQTAITCVAVRGWPPGASR